MRIAMTSMMAVGALVLVPAVAAQDGETSYMGIDLTAERQPLAPEQDEQRSVAVEMRGLLDEGVELGCLAFEPPATFSQTESDSEACREYLPRLVETTAAPEAGAAATGVSDPENPLRAIPLAELARAAQAGNKRAQLELGIRFEEGVGGVEQNWENALELYRQAGRATPGRRGFRVNRDAEAGQGGSVSAGATSRRIPGLEEARERRDALEARMEALQE